MGQPLIGQSSRYDSERRVDEEENEDAVILRHPFVGGSRTLATGPRSQAEAQDEGVQPAKLATKLRGVSEVLVPFKEEEGRVEVREVIPHEDGRELRGALRGVEGPDAAETFHHPSAQGHAGEGDARKQEAADRDEEVAPRHTEALAGKPEQGGQCERN